MTEPSNQELFEAMKEQDRLYREEANQGLLIRREHAAQLAEAAWGELTSTGPDRSAEWLDGCVAAIEKAAEIIRRGQLRVVK
jgi:hypothetical protein